ncbi:MAG: hypothetical protein PWR10_840 [Halanaerobiales bacterium]|nr:hypothetical protein [Halanaerobiales bacterium]
MKKIFAFVLVVVFVLAFTGIGLAETNVESSWNGYSGDFTTTIRAGYGDSGDDVTSTFYTGAYDNFAGTLTARDFDDNPYSYGVDTFDVEVNASVDGGGVGGVMEFVTQRLDSHTSMYGDSGQRVYSYIWTDDTAEMAYGTWTNYAEMRCSNYGRSRTSEGYQFQANGNFIIDHSITASDDAYGRLWTEGAGTIRINAMSSESGGNSFNFGRGCGCYTNANVSATGTGYISLYAEAPNRVERESGGYVTGDGTAGSASHYSVWNYNGSAYIPNYAVSGN